MTLTEFATERLAPHAARLDTDPALLKATWEAFVATGLHRFTGLGLFEGAGVLAEYSGAFAFLALQQQVAGGPELPVGVAYGHLRNPSGPIPLWENGCVSGEIPWFTGAGIFEKVLLGFRLLDGTEVRAPVSAHNRPEFRHSAPLALTAISSTNTVRVTLTNLPVPEETFLSREPAGSLAAGDANGVLWQVPLLLGSCRASMRLIEQTGRGDSQKTRAWLKAQEAAIAAAITSGDAQEGRRLRAVMGDGAVRLARLAALASGGASALSGHPAERLLREALIFNLMAQTDAIVDDAFAEAL